MDKQKDVKYYSHNSSQNRILRMALLKAWENRCSFCGGMIKSFVNAQIDHIIPQSIYKNGIKLGEIRSQVEWQGYSIPDDVNSVENLAPIHGSCNEVKGDSVSINLKYIEVLEKAKKLSSKIVKDVETARSLSKIRDALIGVDRLDYDNPTIQEDILYCFSILEDAIKEKHPDAVDIFSATLDMSIYAESDHCSSFPVSYVLHNRKFQLDYESCRNFLNLLYCYDLSIEMFFNELESSLDRALMADIDTLISSECVEGGISSSEPVIKPRYDFDLSLSRVRSISGYFEIKGILSGSGSTMIIVPDYPSDDDGYEKQADFWFEYNFEFFPPAIQDGNFSKKLPKLSDVYSNVDYTSFDFDCN